MIEVEFYDGEYWMEDKYVQVITCVFLYTEFFPTAKQEFLFQYYYHFIKSGLVRKFGLVQNNKILGFIYFDLFNRPGKPSAQATMPIRLRKTRRPELYSESIYLYFFVFLH